MQHRVGVGQGQMQAQLVVQPILPDADLHVCCLRDYVLSVAFPFQLYILLNILMHLPLLRIPGVHLSVP